MLPKVELLGMNHCPLLRHSQAGALEQKARVATVFLPLAGGLGELMMEPQAGPVRVDPTAELDPTLDQGLVGHLDVTLLVMVTSPLRRPPPAFGGDQPGIREPMDDLLDRLRVTRGVEQLSERRAPLGVLRPLARLRQPQEDAPANLTLGVIELVDDRIGLPLQRPRTPPISRYAAMVRRRSSRLFHSSQSVYWRNGRAPG